MLLVLPPHTKDVVVGHPTRKFGNSDLKAFTLFETAACEDPQKVYEKIVPAEAGLAGVSEAIANIDVLASVPVQT